MFSAPVSDEDASASAAAFDERRLRMLERLNARHALSEAEAIAVDSINAAASSRSKSISQFDDLQSRARDLVKSPGACVDHSLLTEIEDALTVLPPGLQSRRLREAYNELRARMQQRVIASQKKKFSFSAKPVTKFHVPSADHREVIDDNGQSADALQKTIISTVPLANSVTVSSKENEFVKLVGKGGEDVLLSSLRKCRISIPFSASAVHLKDVHDTVLVFAPVSSSILIRECSNVTMVAAAQQIRIHSSHELKLHVAVRAAVIIEDCDGIQVAPYRVRDVAVDWENDNWRKVNDFNWLSTEQSPHWRVIDESLWQTYDITMCEPCSSRC
uniref:C-CAP/cofactor C-like domain-containing protein n=1 Tax=Parascaris univalens TaxID=6257 RepID=A0A915ANT5_PARUN